MRIIRCGVMIFPFLALFILSCGMEPAAPPEPTQSAKPTQLEQATPEVSPEPESEPEPQIAPEVIEEYARIHQISDMETAEFYVKNPDYAKEHPYEPTEEDIVFYEREFLERMYPKFKKLAEKEGFMRARSIYMRNPPAGHGSSFIGSERYGDIMRDIAAGGGEGAYTGL